MNLPKHKFWGAGEPDCPPELKAPNGELHTMRCKVCGDGWRKSNNVCMEALIEAIRELPFVNAPEIDGEESDGTPRHYRSRRYVSLTKLERLLRGAPGVAAAPALVQQPCEVLAKEAKEFALCIFGEGDVRSDLRELNERIDALAALAAGEPVPAEPNEREAARQLRKAMGVSQDFDDWPLATLMTKAAEHIAALTSGVKEGHRG